MDIEKLQQDLQSILDDLMEAAPLGPRDLLVIGTSTSEIVGQYIGTSGSAEVAAALYEVYSRKSEKHGFSLAFQCCEHLNRALVVESRVAERRGWPEVAVIPVPKAGGAMASAAYRLMEDPVVVESIQADAGIDIGDTFIGMHIKPVAVPVRPRIKELGSAHVTMARTRAKLIGGPRAVYVLPPEDKSCT